VSWHIGFEETGAGVWTGDVVGFWVGLRTGAGVDVGDGACDMTKQIHCGHCEYKCNMTKTKLGVIVYIPKLTQLGPAADVEHPL